MTYEQLFALLQGGGVTVLAVLVYFELRALRPVIRALEIAVGALLERARMMDTGPIERIDQPNIPRVPTLRRLPTKDGD